MNQQTPAPLVAQNLDLAPRELNGLVGEYREGFLILDAPYQRGSVWTDDQRKGLIRSWLLGLPIPAIILNDRRTGGWTAPDGSPDFTIAVVDGRQRIETAIAWFGDEFAVPASWFPAERVRETVTLPSGPHVTYSGLTTEAQRYFKRLAKAPVAVAKVATLAEEAAIYLLVNGSGTPQTDEDMDNARSYA